MDRVIAFLKKISLKQILAVFLAGFMVLTLAACGGAEVGDTSGEEAPAAAETTEQPAPEAAEAADSEAADSEAATSEEAADSEAASASVDEASATSEEG